MSVQQPRSVVRGRRAEDQRGSNQERPRAYPGAVAQITVKLPSDEEEDLLRRFTVNRNYLQAVRGFISTTYGRREKLYDGLRAAVEAMPQYQKIQRGHRI